MECEWSCITANLSLVKITRPVVFRCALPVNALPVSKGVLTVFGDTSKTDFDTSKTHCQSSISIFSWDDERLFAPSTFFSQQPSGLIMVVQVQVDAGIRYDRFTELPVSLVLFSLICVDIVERIRPLRLTGQGKR